MQVLSQISRMLSVHVGRCVVRCLSAALYSRVLESRRVRGIRTCSGHSLRFSKVADCRRKWSGGSLNASNNVNLGLFLYLNTELPDCSPLFSSLTLTSQVRELVFLLRGEFRTRKSHTQTAHYYLLPSPLSSLRLPSFWRYNLAWLPFHIVSGSFVATGRIAGKLYSPPSPSATTTP